MTQTEPGLSLDFLGKLHVALGGVSTELRRLREERERPPMQPFTFEQTRQGLMPAVNTYPQVINMGGPSQGFVWEARNVAVTGLSVDTTVAGNAYLFVRSGEMAQTGTTTLAQMGVTGVRDLSIGLPNVAFYGRGQVTVRAGQKLWLVLASYTVSIQYIVSAEIEQYQEGVLPQVVAT